jgi:hypothetical protein
MNDANRGAAVASDGTIGQAAGSSASAPAGRLRNGNGSDRKALGQGNNGLPARDSRQRYGRRVAQWQSAARTRQRRGFNSFRAYQ